MLTNLYKNGRTPLQHVTEKNNGYIYFNFDTTHLFPFFMCDKDTDCYFLKILGYHVQ